MMSHPKTTATNLSFLYEKCKFTRINGSVNWLGVWEYKHNDGLICVAGTISVEGKIEQYECSKTNTG